MPSQKLKSSKKERKKVMRTLAHQEETSSLTWVLLLFLLSLQEVNNVAAKKKARDRDRERDRQESEGWQAGSQQRRRKGRREAQLAAATKQGRARTERRSLSCCDDAKRQTAEQRTRQAGYIPGARRAWCVRLNG